MWSLFQWLFVLNGYCLAFELSSCGNHEFYTDFNECMCECAPDGYENEQKRNDDDDDDDDRRCCSKNILARKAST